MLCGNRTRKDVSLLFVLVVSLIPLARSEAKLRVYSDEGAWRDAAGATNLIDFDCFVGGVSVQFPLLDFEALSGRLGAAGDGAALSPPNVLRPVQAVPFLGSRFRIVFDVEVRAAGFWVKGAASGGNVLRVFRASGSEALSVPLPQGSGGGWAFIGLESDVPEIARLEFTLVVGEPMVLDNVQFAPPVARSGTRFVAGAVLIDCVARSTVEPSEVSRVVTGVGNGQFVSSFRNASSGDTLASGRVSARIDSGGGAAIVRLAASAEVSQPAGGDGTGGASVGTGTNDMAPAPLELVIEEPMYFQARTRSGEVRLSACTGEIAGDRLLPGRYTIDFGISAFIAPGEASAESSVEWELFLGTTPGNVFFVGGGGSGTTDGVAFRASDGVRVDDTDDSASISFVGKLATGDTSGGLVDGALRVEIASLFLGVTGGIENTGPGVDTLTITLSGQADWFEPEDYFGSLGCAVLVDRAVVLALLDPVGDGIQFTVDATGTFAGVDSLRRVSDGMVFPSGSVVEGGDYVLFSGASLGVSARPSQTRDCQFTIDGVTCLDSTITAIFSVPPPCRCDFNRDGLLETQDFFEFLAAMFALDMRADFNRDGVVGSQDMFEFLASFFAPPPACG